MKGRSGSTGVATTHESLGSTRTRASMEEVGNRLAARDSLFQRQLRPARLPVAVAGLAIAILLGAFFVSYGSKLYRELARKPFATSGNYPAYSRESSIKAAQMARELLTRHPDSLPALSILADTAERQNLEEAVSWRERIARLRPKDPESQLNLPPLRSALGSSISREKRLIESLRTIVTAQPFMSLQAGWRARKVILPSKKNNSPPR